MKALIHAFFTFTERGCEKCVVLSTYACAVSDLFFRSTAAGERNMAASLICGRLSAGLRNSGSRTALSSTAKVGFGEEISRGYI